MKAGAVPANYATMPMLDIEVDPAAADAEGIENIVMLGGPKPGDEGVPSAQPETYAHPWENPGAWKLLGSTKTARLKPKFDAFRSVLRYYDEDEPRDYHGRWTTAGGGTTLEVHEYEGQTGNNDHITRTETGTIPTSAIAQLKGANGEQPGEHTTRSDAAYEKLKADIAANGMKTPIFITVDYDEDPVISEGNNRRDVAVDLGIKNVPVEIRYFGHAEDQGTVVDRHPAVTFGHPGFGPDESEGEFGRSLRFDEAEHPRGPDGRWITKDDGEDEDGQPTLAGMPKKKKDWLPDGWERKVSTHGGVVYRHGGTGKDPYIKVTYPANRAGLSDEQADAIQEKVVTTLDDLMTRFPVDIDELNVRIDFSMPDALGGATTYVPALAHGEYSMDLNGNLLSGKIEDQWFDGIENGNLMYSAIKSPQTYVIAHEYGHVVDGVSGSTSTFFGPITSVQSHFIDAGAEGGKDLQRALLADMSAYATSSPGEAAAEGFADYYMSDGKSTNQFTRLMIQAYKDAGVIK